MKTSKMLDQLKLALLMAIVAKALEFGDFETSVGVSAGAATDYGLLNSVGMDNVGSRVMEKAKTGFSNIKEAVSTSNNTHKEPADEFEKEPVNPACTKEKYRAHHSGDIAKLARECPHISGSIIINDFLEPVLELGPLVSIGGDLEISNVSNLVRIDAPNLASIGKRFQLSELTSLTSISFPYLKSVETIDWKVLPILSTIGFDAGLDRIRNILISDTSLVGFSLKEKVKSLDSLNLNNNRFLESISSNIESVTGYLSIAANARNTAASFPALESVSNLTVRDVTSLDLSSIKEISGSANFYENYFQQLKVPKLKFVGGTLSIIENLNLKDVDFPNVSEVGGGLMISNNTNIDKINFFPKLKMIGGAIQFIGDFKEATFSKLQLVKGSALIRSASGLFDCSKWTDTNNLIIRGGNIACSAGNKKEELHYDANNVQGTLTRSESGSTNEDSKPSVPKYTNKSTKLTCNSLDYILTMGLFILGYMY